MASSIADIYRRQLRPAAAPAHPTRQAQPGFQGFDPRTGALDPGPLGGFIASALSAIPEFVGAEPSQTAEAFRAQHPWMGFASELLPLTIPYAGAFRLSRVPSLAARLESAVARVADPVTQPIRAGVVRELVRYVPTVELPRLAVGGMAYPENFGELFADVAFSSAIAGGLGAIGGMFRAGGRATRQTEARVLGADAIAAPTLQLQLLRAGGEPVDAALGREATERLLVNEVFTERSGKGAVSRQRLPSIAPLEGARGSADTAEVNALFALSEAPETGVRRQSLIETPEARLNTLNPGGQAQLVADLQAAGSDIDSVADLAASAFYPRRLYAVDNRGAAVLGRLTENPTLTRVNDNLWLAREEGDGLFVGVMRLPRQAATAETADALVAASGTKRARRYGPGKVQAGDQFLLFKTNQPARFSPQQHAVLQSNYATWATWRQAYQEPVWSLSRMGQAENELSSIITPQDFRDLHRFSAASWQSRLSDRVTKRLTGELGLTDSEVGRAFARNAYEMMAPTMFKQGKNSLFARFTLTQTARIREVTREVNRNFLGETNIGTSLLKHIHRKRFKPAYAEGTYTSNIMAIPDSEWGLFIKAAITQTPADDLAKLTASGVVSAQTTTAIRNIQALKRRYDMEFVLPELKAAGLAEKFNMLEGYVMPVPRLGDYLQAVKDEAGKVVQVVSGRNPPHANRQAQAIVDEAQAQGRTWTTGKAEVTHVAEYSTTELDKLFADTMRRLGTDEAADSIIQKAMQRISYLAHPSTKRGPRLGISDPQFFKERSGLTTIVELPTRKEVLQQMYAHEVRLGNYAAMQGWTERWGGELTRFQKYDPVLHQDVLRKRDQHLGIEGQITNTLNRALQPVLGHLLGAKPATRIAEVTNKAMFKFNLAWINPTFALLNVLTPVMTGLPEIAFALKAGPSAFASHYNMVPVYGANALPRGMASVLDPLKVLWQGVRDMRKPTPEQLQLVRELVEDGSLASHLPLEYLGAQARMPTALNAAYRRSYIDGFDEAASYMATRSEEMSRMLSALMGHRLGQTMGLEPARMKMFVRKFVENTNYLYGVTDRPRIFTGPLGSMFGLFKNWQMHYLGMMSHYAGVAWRENVYSPLLWQSAAALSIGGLGATPLRHLADGISNWYTSDPESYRQMLENWGSFAGQPVADEIWFGLPAFLGISLQTSAAVPGTDVRNEITNLGNIVVWERAKQLGTAVGSYMDQASATGDASVLYNNPNVRDQLLSAISPRVISRAISTTEGDYVRSMRTGYPQVRELSGSTRLLHGMGMNQVEVERQQQAARELWRDQQRRRAMITGLGGAYAQAILHNDGPEAEQLIQRAILLGLPLSSVMRSAQNFQRREVEADSLSRFDQMEAGRWIAALDQAGP